MIEKPTVSVIMNCLNGEPFLAEAIESVLAQDMQDLEIIFFDNDSTDRSAEIARSYGSKLRYFKSETTIPLGAARNRAIVEAMGKYIVFLDCDDLWLPAKLGRQVAAMEAPSSSARPFGMCYTDAMRIDADGNDLIAYSHKRQLLEGDLYRYLIQDAFISMSSALVDREVFHEVGGFNDRYSYVEEWDLWLRISRDYDVALVPQILTKIRLHGSNQSRDGAAQDEKLALIRDVRPVNAAEGRARESALKDFRIRVAIAKLTRAKDAGIWATAAQVFRTASYCIASPLTSFRLIRLLLNPKMLKVFWLKHF